VVLFFSLGELSSTDHHRQVLDVALAALPLSDLITLLIQDSQISFCEQFWSFHAPKWPFLRRAQLEDRVQDEFTAMLKSDHSTPLLPALTELTLVGPLSPGWAFALERRANLGLPLERLDLRMCIPRSPEDLLPLHQIVVDFLAPENPAEIRERMTSRWQTVVCASISPASDIAIKFELHHHPYTHDGLLD
jgi:hypothetical protein